MSGQAIPVVDPRETITSMTNRVSAVPMRTEGWLWWWLAFVPSAGLLGFGLLGVGWAFLRGIRVWGNDWPVMWGFPILAYVWWIAIASGGTFVSAFFFLVRVEWRTSINRLAETMTLFAAVAAGVYPILHLGRPYFAYWLFPYPNTMTLWPQWKSPLLWDFMALLTYVIASVLFWFIGIMPDLATMRDRAQRRSSAAALWDFFALGLPRNGAAQWRHLKATYGVSRGHHGAARRFGALGRRPRLSRAPPRPGWHSTEYPPFFVFGALWSGLASVDAASCWPSAVRSELAPAHHRAPHPQFWQNCCSRAASACRYAYMLRCVRAFLQRRGHAERTQFINAHLRRLRVRSTGA